jgi:hypothetical protein
VISAKVAHSQAKAAFFPPLVQQAFKHVNNQVKQLSTEQDLALNLFWIYPFNVTA